MIEPVKKDDIGTVMQEQPALIFYLPGVPVGRQLLENMREAIGQAKNKSGQLFPGSKEERVLFVDAIFETKYYEDVEKGKLAPSKLYEVLQAIAMNQKQGFDEQILYTVKEQVEALLQISWLEPIVRVLLMPAFYAHCAETGIDQVFNDKTLFEVVSSSPQWKEVEKMLSNKEKQEMAAILGKRFSSELAMIIGGESSPEKVDLSLDVGFELMQKRANHLLSKLKVYLVQQGQQTVLECFSKEVAYAQSMIQKFLNISHIAFSKNNDEKWEINLSVTKDLYDWIEGKEGEPILNPLFHGIANLVKTMKKEVSNPLDFNYKIVVNSGSNDLDPDVVNKPPKSLKHFPGRDMQKALHHYNVGDIPVIQWEKYLKAYGDSKALEVQMRRITRGGSIVTCVSPTYNTDFIYAALDKKRSEQLSLDHTKITAYSVPAADLIAMVRDAGLAKNEWQKKHGNNKKFDNSNLPFFAIPKFTDYLVITGAEKFFRGDGPGTLSWICDSETYRTNVILVSASEDISALPELRKDEKKKRDDIPMQALLGLNLLAIPDAPVVHKCQQLQSELTKMLSANLFSNAVEVPKFSADFYKGLQLVSGGDYRYLKILLRYVADKIEDGLTQEKIIFATLMDDMHQKKLLKTPISISVDEIYQIIAARYVQYMQNSFPDEGYSIGDRNIRDQIVVWMSQVYSTLRPDIYPIMPVTSKSIVACLQKNHITTTQSSLSEHKNQPVGREYVTAIQEKETGLLTILRKQLLHKIYYGQIDDKISPIQKDPLV